MQYKELLKRIKAGQPPTVLDVRSDFEYRSGHIPGAIHSPALKILFHMAPIPSDRNAELVVTCEHGPRAGLAKGLLGILGYQNVTLLEGHMSAWRQGGHTLEK